MRDREVRVLVYWGRGTPWGKRASQLLIHYLESRCCGRHWLSCSAWDTVRQLKSPYLVDVTELDAQGTLISAQDPHQSSENLRAGPKSSMACRKLPFSVSKFPNLGNRATDPSLSTQAFVQESLAGSIVISGQVRRNKGPPQESCLWQTAGPACSWREEEPHQIENPPRWRTAWKSEQTSALERLWDSDLLKPISKVAILQKWQYRQKGRDLEEHRSQRKSPHESSYPNTSRSGTLRAAHKLLVYLWPSPYLPLLVSLGHSGDVEDESDPRMGWPKAGTCGQAGKCAHVSHPGPATPASSHLPHCILHTLSWPLSGLSPMRVCHFCLPISSLTQQQC